VRARGVATDDEAADAELRLSVAGEPQGGGLAVVRSGRVRVLRGETVGNAENNALCSVAMASRRASELSLAPRTQPPPWRKR
jgi:hypothetical protein